MEVNSPPYDAPASRCRIEEVSMFFECQPKKSPGQPPRIDCSPVPRFFLLCEGSPALEVTRAVKTDADTGKPVLSTQLLRNLPSAKEWRQVIKHANDRPLAGHASSS
ncbi:hypothetical protein BD626DRAFT_574526 [Schizophyllum amplum]|uniref:Uncharacterized protein n=1 Tax=Schizophyllum amplum TaxID=97359 RepID=A0A550BY63_9AGAR|nr:hypothetical protein BD626DRAFT_574526 [Auriculariopsis ampla]